MGVSKRFILLMLLGVLLTLAAWPLGAYLIVFLAWNTLVVGLLILDAILTPSTKRLVVSRKPDNTLYYGTNNELEITANNTSRTRLYVSVRSEILRYFTTSTPPGQHIGPGQSVTYNYDTVPSKRGDFSENYVFVKLYSVLGICVKYAKYTVPTRYKVYPNILDLSNYRILMQKSRRLPAGEKHVRQYGVGQEFESLRPYVPGDDYRKINWAATARESRLITNQFQIERDQPVYIMVDIGRPMSYTVNGYKKLDYAMHAAVVLCDIVNQQGDKAGLMLFGTSVLKTIAPGQGVQHRNNILEALYRVQDNRRTSNYEAAFLKLCQSQKRRSLVFIFTDFELLEEAEDLITNIALLKRNHLPIVVFMENESLRAMANGQHESAYGDTLSVAATEFLDERRQILHKLNIMGIPSVESNAENFTTAAVNRYLRYARG